MKYDKGTILEAKNSFQKTFGEKIDAAVVMGSGLSGHIAGMDIACEIPFSSVKNMPVSGVAGHTNRFVVARTAGKNVLFMLGRIHLYEGYSPFQTALAVAMLGELCVSEIILTNVSGGINASFAIGDIMAITDHINLQNSNPLTGIGDSSRFLNMSAPYNTKFLKDMQKHFHLKEGVYAALPGPSYETPAEIRYLRTIGADAVGMSTVMETIMANYYGMNVYGLSVITNLAFHPRGQLSHNEVLETGDTAGKKLMETIAYLLKAVFA